jgi:1,4-alpha-glucan branching enzyme
MRILGTSAIWELFVPGLEEGDKYKFEIMTHEGFNLDKADPFAFMAEIRPKTASVVYDYNKYSWQDSKWMEKRAATNWMEEPMLIYEVHLGSWMRNVEDGNRWLTYREMADRLIPYVKSMGYSHVELLPVSEHPFDGSWGYQVTGYYAPTSRFGAPDDFKYLVDRFHQEGIGIILDWVPAHFPKDPHSLGRFDGTCVYEHMDPRQGEHQDWGTLIFNYGRNEVRNFLLSNAMYWFDKFHIDGLRIDAVASMLYLDYSRKDGQWVPNQYGGRENLEAVSFLRQLNEMVYAYNKGAFTVAEESTAWPMVSRPLYIGGLGFGFKWNMGWMNDILAYFKEDPIYRKYHHNKLTFAIWYAFTENFHLSISHDEVVHGKGSLINKMPGDVEEKFANLRLFFAYMYAHPGKKLHFMGSEFAQWKEWNHDSELDWWLLQYEEHRNFHTFMKELNHFYRGENSLWENDFDSSGFEWIDFSDSDNSIVSFIRRGKGKRDWIVCVFNFTPITRYGYHVGVPIPCFYSEVFNSNSELYGGSNIGNMGGVWADDMSCHGHYHSIPVTIPGFSAVFLRPELPEEPEIVISEPVSELVSEPVTETVVPQLPELAGKKSEVGKSAGKIVTKTVKKPDEKTKKTSDAKASSPKKTSGPAVKKTVKPKSDSGKKPRGGK